MSKSPFALEGPRGPGVPVAEDGPKGLALDHGRNFNIAHWTEMPRGGQVAALEEPELFVTDVGAFFRKLR
jgi:hypothetical protein